MADDQGNGQQPSSQEGALGSHRDDDPAAPRDAFDCRRDGSSLIRLVEKEFGQSFGSVLYGL
jgi:hypothetical protein